jgi:hypothetical protein
LGIYFRRCDCLFAHESSDYKGEMF